MVKNKGLRAVIFDLDGTLLDTLRDIAEAMNRSLSAMGFPTHEIKAYRQFVGEGATVLAQRVLPEGLRHEEKIHALRELFIKDYRSNWNRYTRPYPGITGLLDTLKELRVPMAIFSNKPHYFTENCVREFLDRWPFQMVLGESESCPRKPAPDGALKIADAIGIDPGEIVFVGDTKIDMLTAQNAGMYPCGVLWGFRDREELLQHGAQSLLEHPGDLIDLLALQGDG